MDSLLFEYYINWDANIMLMIIFIIKQDGNNCLSLIYQSKELLNPGENTKGYGESPSFSSVSQQKHAYGWRRYGLLYFFILPS
jgi:hypothetical protein